MVTDIRLNILLTHAAGRGPKATGFDDVQPWYELLALLLAPLGVRTFEATEPNQAVRLIEQNPIHLAVVDTRLSAIDQLGLLRLISQLRQTPLDQNTGQMRVKIDASAADEASEDVPVRRVARRPAVEQRGDAPAPQRQSANQPVWPAVILVTPARDDQLLTQALKFDAFSVLPEPVDVNVMLDLMARALRRFHRNLWPQ